VAIAIKFSIGESVLAFQFAVSLGVRLLIAASTRSGSVELPLASVAHGVFSGDLETARDVNKRLNGVTPGDEEFKSSFETVRVSKAQLARYYLRSLETVEIGASEPWFIPTEDRSVINLEHVLPKKPEGNWPQFSEDEVALYVNRLGNQALMQASDNSSVRSAGFSEKRLLYAKSPYRLTSLLGKVTDWTPTAVFERQKYLAGLATAAWPT
jgi:hypothetical protein